MPSSDGKSIGGENNHFYSINIGPIHFVLFNTEFYYYLEYGFQQIKNQFDWLKKDFEVSILCTLYIYLILKWGFPIYILI